MDYMNIASLGNATFFGNLSQAASAKGQLANTTRTLMAGDQGISPDFIRINVIEYVTISTTGDAQDFGDLTTPSHGCGACSSSTRGIFTLASTPGGVINNIEYVTISSLGDSQDFGDLTLPRSSVRGTSDSTRGIFPGGWNAPFARNIIDYITIATKGNAIDFGDTDVINYMPATTSDSHGGI